MKVEFEPIVGRYAHFEIDGRKCRVYFEEAGQGIPMVCLHTAGADGRQFRHLLCDPDVTRDYRVLALDVPWHGKSYPPEDWLWDEEYRLTTDLYVKTIVAFSEAMGLDRPVLIGSSIGGRILLQVAHLYQEKFRAYIACEAADHQDPWYDTAWLNRGDVHGGEVCAALVSGMCAPQSPKRYRMETLWQYAQGGPGIFKGDLYFYRVDSDLRGKLGNIDTKKAPMFMLTGEYDFSCTPEDTMRTAKSIPGAQVQIMKEAGHFPMSENPAQFKKYLMPVLEQIKGASKN